MTDAYIKQLQNQITIVKQKKLKKLEEKSDFSDDQNKIIPSFGDNEIENKRKIDSSKLTANLIKFGIFEGFTQFQTSIP